MANRESSKKIKGGKMMKNDVTLVKRSRIRYNTSKTGTHVMYFDCVSKHQRRLNLSLANLYKSKQN